MEKESTRENRQIVMQIIREQSPITQKQIGNACSLKTTQIRYAIRRLRDKNEIDKIPDLVDMRGAKYFPIN